MNKSQGNFIESIKKLDLGSYAKHITLWTKPCDYITKKSLLWWDACKPLATLLMYCCKSYIVINLHEIFHVETAERALVL